MCSTVHRCVCTFVSVCIFGLSSKYLPICLYVSMYVDTIIMCCVMHAFRWSVSLYLSAYRFNFSCAVSVSLSVRSSRLNWHSHHEQRWVVYRCDESTMDIFVCIQFYCCMVAQLSTSILPMQASTCAHLAVSEGFNSERNLHLLNRLPLRAPNKTAVIRISNIILVHSMDVHV